MALADAPVSQPQPGREVWRIRGGDPATRMRSWSEILAATHLAFDVRATPRTPERFQGAVTRRAIGDLMLVDCAASPFVGKRSQPVIGGRAAATNEEVFGFQFVCKGVELVREGERELALNAGDIVLWDGMQPTEVEIAEAFYKRTLLFPRDQVIALCPRLAEVSTLPSLRGSVPARLLVRYMNALALESPLLDPAGGAAAANAALRAAARGGRASPSERPRHGPGGAPSRDHPLRPHPPAGPRARPVVDRARLRDVSPCTARAVRGR